MSNFSQINARIATICSLVCLLIISINQALAAEALPRASAE